MQVMPPTTLCKIHIVTTLLTLDQPYNILAHELFSSNLLYQIICDTPLSIVAYSEFFMVLFTLLGSSKLEKDLLI